MTIRLRKSHALAVVVVGTLLAFQNCAPSTDTSANDAASYDDGLPFAYDAKPDTLAYMSCSEISQDMSGVTSRRAYFSFRLGGYNDYTSGVTLNSAFRTATQYYTPEVRAQTLASSVLSGNTRLSFSFRRRANIQSWWSETPGLKTSIDGMLPPMESAEVAGPLSAQTASPGLYRNYFPSANDKRLMEGSLNVLNSEIDAQKIRDNLEQGGDPTYLVMGYSGTSDEMDMTLKTPITYASDKTTVVATPVTRAYGLAFQPSFGVPAGTSTGTRRVMTGLSEIDLSTGVARPANWKCLAEDQYMVVRPEDAYNDTSLCSRQPDPLVQSDALKRIRRVLRTEDWFVDMTKKCVVPKNTGDLCYGATLSNRTIRYRQAGCQFNAGDGTTCAHWVSVCVRP